MKPCANCGMRARPRATRCGACAGYKRRHGFDRPEEMIVAHAQRLQERLHLRRMVRNILAANA